MSKLSRKPTTVKELKAALSALPDATKIEIYEGDEISRISLATLKMGKRTVIVL